MADFALKIGLDNAAFESPGTASEVARILRDLADRIDTGCELVPSEWRLRDINGNTCGRATATA